MKKEEHNDISTVRPQWAPEGALGWKDGLIVTRVLSSERDLVQGWPQEPEVARQALENILARGWLPHSERERPMVERLRAAGLLRSHRRGSASPDHPSCQKTAPFLEREIIEHFTDC